MRVLISFPLVALMVMFQSAIVSRLPLLAGYADILLVFLVILGLQEGVVIWPWAAVAGLMVGFVSAVPWPAVLVGYLLVAMLTWLLRRRIWNAPLLASFTVVFLATLLMHALTFLTLRLLGGPIRLGETLEQVTLPSLLLNLLLVVVAYPFVRDLATWVYPPEEML